MNFSGYKIGQKFSFVYKGELVSCKKVSKGRLVLLTGKHQGQKIGIKGQTRPYDSIKGLKKKQLKERYYQGKAKIFGVEKLKRLGIIRKDDKYEQVIEMAKRGVKQLVISMRLKICVGTVSKYIRLNANGKV